MKMKKLLGVFFAVNLLVGISSATANTIWLEPAFMAPPPLGSTIQLTLHMNFTEPTIGGGLDLFYDNSMLDFVSFVFNPTFVCPGCPSDPAYSRPGDDLPGEVNGIGIGNLSGISGYHLIGTFTFIISSPGLTALWMADNDSPVGPFLDMTGSSVLPVDYRGSLITPLPAAAWLMLAGLGLLVGFGRRKLGGSA